MLLYLIAATSVFFSYATCSTLHAGINNNNENITLIQVNTNHLFGIFPKTYWCKMSHAISQQCPVGTTALSLLQMFRYAASIQDV